MPLSMTGYGEARFQGEAWSAAVEIRAVNNRHFKLTCKLSEPYTSLETEIERLVRAAVRRGTVMLSARVERPKRADDYRLNEVALKSYYDQLSAINGGRPVDVGDLLMLPGVVVEVRPEAGDPRDEWPAIERVVVEAIERLQSARAEEGAAMGRELLELSRAIRGHLSEIDRRSGTVVSAYRDRLIERVRSLVAEQGIAVEPADLIREVAIYAERSDIAEEIVRLSAHLQAFEEALGETEGSGRKLEFVVQEMGRETNTIGSKAGDVSISREVVSIKGILEKIRELILNIE